MTSIESDKQWFEQVKKRTGANSRLHLETDPAKYAQYVAGFDGFDVIVIDGIFEDGGRLKCTEHAIGALRPGGLIILDNSDWLPLSSRLLRDSGLIEVDMAGVAPLNSYACTTSLFISRDFKVKCLNDSHPPAAVGGIVQNWERFGSGE